MAASRLCFFWILIVLRTAAGFLQEEEEDLNETVLCSNDQMKVVIPSIFFLRKDPPVFVGDLHLNDPECRGVEVGEDYVFSIKTNLSDCGTIMVSDQSHIMFTNSIHNNESQVISRNYVNISFSCRYPVRYLVQQPGGGHGVHVHLRTITLNTEDGNFSVSMLLFKDEAFEDRWATVPFLRLEDHVFVKVFMVEY
ncbi:Alpha-tectorin [Dissostichus eleginoides]|uniref:Alpha-tectorin n=1 Tax=Dissostichus eleginoides TaxID=100907 RepID=A0AAD9F9Y8_DISEL|nr:Alpha-tectorin [Dissostichus eleginoides]